MHNLHRFIDFYAFSIYNIRHNTQNNFLFFIFLGKYEVNLMGYDGVHLKKSFSIGKIYSIHYFEYMNDFSFVGESHDFWEFICVDKGEVGVTSGSNFSVLKKGEIAFHQPNEFHNVRATGSSAPNLVVISFECKSLDMDFFRQRTFKVDDTERNLLADIIIETRRSFDCRLDDPYLQNMPLKDTDNYDSQQLIKLYLEHFLIHLKRRYSNPVVLRKKIPKATTAKSTKRKGDAETFNRVVDYLETCLACHVTIEQICQNNLIGRSQLQRIFKEQTSLGVIEYFSNMKINAAKEMIRTNQMNFSQIAEHLGYSSIHYFSRQFKKITGMSPTDYASSIKAMAEGTFS